MPILSRPASSATSRGGRSTKRPTASVEVGSAATISAARDASTYRGEAGWKFRPIQSAPAPAQARASETLVSPQTLMRTSSAATRSGNPELLERGLELRLGVHADEPVDLLARLEDQHGRDRRDPEAPRCLLVLVGVHLANLDLA